MEISNSERLSYALMGPEDADLLFQLDQDEAVMKYINGGKKTTMQEIRDLYLPRLAKYTRPDMGWGMWKVTITDTAEFIGWVLVRPMDFFSDQPQWNNWELGWRFMQKSWGCGYATEAAKQVMKALADVASLNKFSAIAIPDNQASINIMKKLGMHYIKTGAHHDPLGNLEKVVYYETIPKTK